MILLRGPDMLSKRRLIFKSPFDFFAAAFSAARTYRMVMRRKSFAT
jgi:hypothetical protein